jgi:hypothetical protein
MDKILRKINEAPAVEWLMVARDALAGIAMLGAMLVIGYGFGAFFSG